LKITSTAQVGGLTDVLFSRAYSAALCKLIAKNKKFIYLWNLKFCILFYVNFVFQL